MRSLMAMLVLGAIVAAPGWAPADEPDDEDEPTREEITRDQVDALEDLEHAETDEEAEAAEDRFNDASADEVRRRRRDIDDLIESGGTVPSDRPPPPDPRP